MYPGNTIAANGEDRKDLLVGLTAADTKTVVRVIGHLDMQHPIGDDSEGSNTVDVAIGVTSREAFDLGTLPDPDNVADYPMVGWLYMATKLVSQHVNGTTGVWRHNATFDFDIRASRKVDRGVLWITILNKSFTGGNSIEIFGRVRALCLT